MAQIETTLERADITSPRATILVRMPNASVLSCTVRALWARPSRSPQRTTRRAQRPSPSPCSRPAARAVGERCLRRDGTIDVDTSADAKARFGAYRAESWRRRHVRGVAVRGVALDVCSARRRKPPRRREPHARAGREGRRQLTTRARTGICRPAPASTCREPIRGSHGPALDRPRPRRCAARPDHVAE